MEQRQGYHGIPYAGHGAMKWVTRERAKVDRIACPWLIQRFIDPGAEFLYVPKEQVAEVARAQSAIPYDTPEAEIRHFREGDEEFVSFDALLRKFRLSDPALLELAKIVRVADGGSGESAEAAGLVAAATGFREIAKDDLENQRLQFPLYDALYAFCRSRVDGRAAPSPTGR